MSLLKTDELERLRMSALFWEYVDLEANNIIHHEDISAWNAPSECHGIANRGYEKAMQNLEQRYGGEGSIAEMFNYFGYHCVERTVARLYNMRSPFN